MSDSIPALTTLPMHLLNARQNMVETGFYLGELGLHDRVKWVRDGRADHLVVAAPAAKSDDMDSGTSPLSDDGAKEYPSPPPEDFEPAPLCAVVRISTCDFWLTADAGYRTSSIWKSFSDAKVTCAAERPEFEPFMDDYITVSDNLRWLQESIETPGFRVKKGLFLLANNAGARFKVRHALFELKNHEGFNSTDDNASDGPSEDSEDVQDEESSMFNIRNWPTYSDVAKNALDTIKETHNVVPIPAYDLSGHLIKPRAYHAKLEGALVELYFTLTHWSIAGKANETPTDTYTADIVMIQVLAAPSTVSAPSPKKRHNVDLFIDPSGSPTKRIHRS